MRSFLKFAMLLALIIGGKLSKSPQPAALASPPKAPPAARVLVVNQPGPVAPVPAGPNQAAPASTQVLSVFFK